MSTLSRHQKRRLAATSDAVQRVTDADGRYFERFPWRSHRVRHAARAELAANAAVMDVAEIQTEPGYRWFAVIRQIEPGVRSRLFVQNAEETDPEMDEAAARTVYEALARRGSSQALQLEEKIRRVVQQRRGWQ